MCDSVSAAVAGETLFEMGAVEAFGAEVFGADALFSAAAGYEVPAAWAASGAGVAAGVDAGASAADTYSTFESLGNTAPVWNDSSMWDMAAENLFANAGMPGFNQYGAAEGFGWGDVKGALQIASPIMAIGSGLYGMNQADQLRKMAAMSGKRADPWGMSGGRSLADAQLQELMTNPGQVAGRDPSYALRMQGAQRATAIQGQDSGAMAVAGANASTDWYNQRLAQLGGLAGATQNPAAGEQVSMSGQLGANGLASRSLASIGYGVTRGGGGTGMELPVGFREQLRAAGYAV